MEMGLELGIVDPIRIIQIISVNLFSCTGFGKLEIVEISARPPKAILRVYDSLECELGLEDGKSYGQLIRGIIAGFLTVFFDRRMKAEEIKCIAKSDPYCEFTVGPE